MNSYKNFLGGVTLLFLAMTLLVFCSPLKRSVGLTGGIFGKIRFPMEESQFLLEKDTLLKQVSITIKGTDIKANIDKDGYFWFLDLPTGNFTVKYAHKLYGPHEIDNVPVKHAKLTMMYCRFKWQGNLKDPRKTDWYDESEQGNMGFLPMVDVTKRGALSLKFWSKNDLFISLAIPKYTKESYLPQLKGTVYKGQTIGGGVFFDNILPGNYVVAISHLLYLENLIIKADSVAEIKNISFSPEPLTRYLNATPIYKQLKKNGK
jgi:hypothetical protein